MFRTLLDTQLFAALC